jgi:hypothetical protein
VLKYRKIGTKQELMAPESFGDKLGGHITMTMWVFSPRSCCPKLLVSAAALKHFFLEMYFRSKFVAVPTISALKKQLILKTLCHWLSMGAISVKLAFTQCL